jgi:hypothetical protein
VHVRIRLEARTKFIFSGQETVMGFRVISCAFALLLSLVSFVHAGDPTCARGLLDWNQQTCCPTYCGSCSGGGCDSRPGGWWECCADGVVAKGQQCSTSEAPCKMPAGGGGAAVRAATGDSHRWASIAIMPGDPNKDIYSRMRTYNVHVDSILMYMDVRYLSWYYLKQIMDTGLRVQLVIEFMDSYPNLWDISGGKYDWQLRALFDSLKQDGRQVTVRLLHEFNVSTKMC